jgi:outer membrane receptor protein involved in Fe transport
LPPRPAAAPTTALTWSLPQGEITLGGETRWDRSRYENYFTTARVRDSIAAQVTGRQLSGAPFVQSYFNFGEALRVDLGVRYDALATRALPDGEPAADATHGVLSPKIGALVHVAPTVGVYGNISRGFRSPDGVISDPTLAPITAWAYESGVKLDQGPASVSAALFRMDVSNEQTFNPITLAASSGGASRRQGVELEWQTTLAPRRAMFSGDWTFNDARYRSRVAVPEDGGGAPVVLNGLRVFNTSKYVGAAALDLLPGAVSWRLRLSGNWVGPYSPFDEPGVVLGSYGLAHVSAAWTIGTFEADVGIRNVFDHAYPEIVAGGIVAPGQPRTVYVSLRSRMHR